MFATLLLVYFLFPQTLRVGNDDEVMSEQQQQQQQRLCVRVCVFAFPVRVCRPGGAPRGPGNLVHRRGQAQRGRLERVRGAEVPRGLHSGSPAAATVLLSAGVLIASAAG